jgi:hypothetical protein
VTSDAILAAVAVGVFLLLCLVTWHLVLALKQARLTALAMEQFLTTLRPRVDGVAAQMGALIGRADRLMAAAEEGRGGVGGILGVIGNALGGWTAGTQLVSMIAALIAGVAQAWSRSAEEGAPSASPASGGSHE